MEKVSFFDQVARNKRNSVLLVVAVILLTATLVYAVSYLLVPELAVFFVIIALILMVMDAYASLNHGDKLLLKATEAKPADPVKHIYLINTVEGLSIAAGIAPPKVYIMENDEINAFACGKDPEHASIVVTTGLLTNLNRAELEGVIGHEISHIKNYDIRFATLVAVFVGLVAILSHLLLRSYRLGLRQKGERKVGLVILAGFALAILAPIFSRLVQAAVSREREFLADASSVQLTRYPDGLTSALEKILKINRGEMQVSESISHLFIVDPNKSPLDALFATHPPIEKRIKILKSM